MKTTTVDRTVLSIQPEDKTQNPEAGSREGTGENNTSNFQVLEMKPA